MNITIITDVLPWPLVSGGAQAQFNMIEVLRNIHHITLICPQNGMNKLSAKKELKKLWPNVDIYLYSYIRQILYFPFLRDKMIRAFKLIFMKNNTNFIVERILKPYGLCISNDYINYVNRLISISHPDIVQIEFYPSLQLINYLNCEARKIFVHHELRFVRNNRFLQSFKLSPKQLELKETIKFDEITNLDKYDSVITLSQQDKNCLEDNGVQVPIFVSPAAVNASMLKFTTWTGRISFIGGYSHIPNQEGLDWFAQKVLPLMEEGICKRIDIVGKGWPSTYRTQYGFSLKGFVENLADVVANTILIVPILTGSGMRMKILEAAAMSLPFITTTVGVEGLAFVKNIDCIVADTPEDFAKGLQLLINDENLRKSLSLHAHQVFAEKYSKETLARKRGEIYKII